MLWNDTKFVLMLFTVTVIPVAINCEFFSATDSIFELLETQKTIIDNINAFLSRRNEFFDFLRKLRSDMKREHDIAETDQQGYVENPINAFVLIKRLTVDIRFIIDKLDIFGKKKEVTSMPYPTDEDFVGASESIVRLQDTYQLNATYLAEGKLSEDNNSLPMSANDCFELGRMLSTNGHHYYSNQWFMETLNRLDAENATSIARQYMLQIIAVNNYELSDLHESVKWLDKVLNEYPDQKQFMESKAALTQEIIERELAGEVTTFENESEKKKFNIPKINETIIHDALCRGDYNVSQNFTKRLKCQYDAGRNPYLKFAPFKVEEVYLDPDIRVYYDVLSDSEIDHIKRLSLKKLERAKVLSKLENSTSASTVDKNRISQACFLRDDRDAVVARISRRAGHLAGLSIQSAENLQISTYGIGGHYGPHYDMLFSSKHLKNRGNRIATVLFYMSDVSRGGGTAFIDLDIMVRPIKGSAVVWRNLLPSTDPDLRTRHAACPVLLGSKWVMNKWFHAVGQEFIAPCNLVREKMQVKKRTMWPKEMFSHTKLI